MSGFTAIIDYGVGNLMSVSNALAFLGQKNKITNDITEIQAASSVVLPGVGAFPDAMKQLQIRGMISTLREQAEKKPFLGICLGMQVLFDTGFEGRTCEGLSLIPGEIKLMQTDRKLPHIGWNNLDIVNPSPLLHGLSGGEYVYFVHSYSAVVKDRKNLNAATQYGVEVSALVSEGHVYGCQFHPEKSGEVGLHILKNFVDLNR